MVKSGDSGGGWDVTSWSTLLRLRCAFRQASARELIHLQRPSYENIFTVLLERPIPSTQGYTDLYKLLSDTSLDILRLIRDDVKYRLIDFKCTFLGLHPTFADVMLAHVEFHIPGGEIEDA